MLVLTRVCFLLLASCLTSTAFAQQVWIDVRTPLEHADNGIDGDLLIPFEDILPEVTQRIADKDTEILLYCRSGRRAGIAMSELVAAGYTNVTNIGSVEAARETRQIQQ